MRVIVFILLFFVYAFSDNFVFNKSVEVVDDNRFILKYMIDNNSGRTIKKFILRWDRYDNLVIKNIYSKNSSIKIYMKIYKDKNQLAFPTILPHQKVEVEIEYTNDTKKELFNDNVCFYSSVTPKYCSNKSLKIEQKNKNFMKYINEYRLNPTATFVKSSSIFLGSVTPKYCSNKSLEIEPKNKNFMKYINEYTVNPTATFVESSSIFFGVDFSYITLYIDYTSDKSTNTSYALSAKVGFNSDKYRLYGSSTYIKWDDLYYKNIFVNFDYKSYNNFLAGFGIGYGFVNANTMTSESGFNSSLNLSYLYQLTPQYQLELNAKLINIDFKSMATNSIINYLKIDKMYMFGIGVNF